MKAGKTGGGGSNRHLRQVAQAAPEIRPGLSFCFIDGVIFNVPER